MKPIRTITIIPKLPARIQKLKDLAYNLRWTWSHSTIDLFRRLNSELWEATGHNPVRMLGTIDQQELEEAAQDDAFLAHLDRVVREFEEYLQSRSTWYSRHYPENHGFSVAYFSAEFGLTECLSIFAGGLGILAGDHLKSASDLGIPLVGVGLLYQEGYFRQRLDPNGWQVEEYEDNDFHSLPVLLERDEQGQPRLVGVELPGRTVWAQIWRAEIGRTKLYLLDTNIPQNERPEDRDITDQLYVGDREMRLKQEIMLGIGGYRALEALGIQPTVFHMNEGHSAFLALEHIRRLMERYNLNFHEARELAEPSLVFTTHTPVPAGHEYFAPELMQKYFQDYVQKLGISWTEFMRLGQSQPAHSLEHFCMTALALHLSGASNGVSKLHGQVSQRMWQSIWPQVPSTEIPIGYVTNGVHFRSWVSHDMDLLYDRYLGPRWRDEPADQEVWRRVESIPVEEFWRTHERRRERLVAFARRRLLAQLKRRAAPAAEIREAEQVLDSRILTIGFARRFATYKRATLFLRDPERLARILNHPERPVQIIFAGKAHPQDQEGKRLIYEIASLCRRPEFRRRMVFIEDYDMAVARYLVQGVDVWLNTPRRPNEACGTSGMKAAANGVLNLSTRDGWWDEAFEVAEREGYFIGWAIGRGEQYDDPNYQDEVEAEALYRILEEDIVPTFYNRGPDGIPREWVRLMKSAVAHLCFHYNTHRMVREYTERFYTKAHERYTQLAANGAAHARTLAAWKQHILAHWPEVHIEHVETDLPAVVEVGTELTARAWVRLGALQPEDVRVELYCGKLGGEGEIVAPAAIPMEAVSQDGDLWVFEARHGPCSTTGQIGFTVRVLPSHPLMTAPFIPGFITWA